jgi:hypothetical protein
LHSPTPAASVYGGGGRGCRIGRSARFSPRAPRLGPHSLAATGKACQQPAQCADGGHTALPSMGPRQTPGEQGVRIGGVGADRSGGVAGGQMMAQGRVVGENLCRAARIALVTMRRARWALAATRRSRLPSPAAAVSSAVRNLISARAAVARAGSSLQRLWPTICLARCKPYA